MQRPLPAMKPQSIWTYVMSLTLWLSFCIGVAATVVVLNIRDVADDLTRFGDAYSDHLNKELVSSETILKGFSALFSAVGQTDPAKASRYVRQVIESNPQVFALEIVERVPNTGLSNFVAGKRRHGIPNFSVKSFSYDSDRKWQALEEKPFYYPIVFMEPMPSGSEDVLGLDVESVPFLRHAMTESLQRRAPVASHPFRLVEGNLAYVVFCPISQVFRGDESPLALAAKDQLVVDMVVDAGNLTSLPNLSLHDGETVAVYHKDFGPDDPKGQLLATTGKARSSIETALFPAFVYEKPLATMGHSFALMVKRQVGWSDLSLGLLALIAALTLASSVILVAYLRTHQQRRLLQLENEERLWQLANHDSLTGLPNRMLLMDRMEQLLARTRREGRRMAIMFLDLDDFKQVNDTYGHGVGDHLLKLVAERLQASVRAGDTVARLSGDEFLVLIESPEDPGVPEAVSVKIRQKLAEGFLVDGQLIHVQTSMGIAAFPEDGETPEALMKQADKRMYANKQARSVKLHIV